jgi:hypothetical protein
VIAGNQQGFVMLLDQGTSEGPSGYIQSITTLNSLALTIGSPNHCLMEGDYLQLQNITGDTALNGLIGVVGLIISGNSADANNFTLTFLVAHNYNGMYTSGGLFARLCQPFFQTKQFAPFWEAGSQVRLGVQKYLLDGTSAGQITVNMYLSQDPDDPWNAGLIVPSQGSVNNSLIYSQLVYTCPELENIGLTAANVNLQMPTAATQYQIWHRMNTSLIGDTVQLGFTLSDAQMRNIVTATSEIALHGIILEVSRGPQLA